MPVTQDFLWIGAVSGLLGLDATAALQVMASRPLVAGGIIGALLGEPAMGLAVGGLIELLWIGGVPVGSLVPPDSTVASVVAVATAVVLSPVSDLPGGADAAASLAVLLSIPAAFIGARAEVMQRHLSSALSRQAEREARQGRLRGVGWMLLAALGLAWMRGMLVTLVSLALAIPFGVWLMQNLPPDAIKALHWCFWLFWLLGLAVAIDHFWDRRGVKYAALLLLLMAVAGTQAAWSQMQLLAVLLVMAHLLGFWRWWRALRGENTP